jgi:hypothetical protein
MAGQENPTPTPAPTIPLCPHCKQPLENVGWLLNSEVGLLTIYHAVSECNVALNCQMIPVEARRVTLPEGVGFGRRFN